MGDKPEMLGVSLESAARKAAQRELWEETGLRIKENRLKFLKLGIKNRVYFQLLLRDDDSLSNVNDGDDEKAMVSRSLKNGQAFALRLSGEHNGFVFEKDITTAIAMISKHSGGKNSEALDVYAQKAKHERNRKGSDSNSRSASKSVHKQKKKGKKEKKRKKQKVAEQ